MTRQVLMLLILFTILLAGCGGNKGMAPRVGQGIENRVASEQKEAADSTSRGIMDKAYAAEQLVQERQVVRNANLGLEVEQVSESIRALEAKTAALGGLVAEVRLDENENRTRASIHVQVPAQELDVLLAWLPGVGKVKNPRLYSEDVTEQYIDMDSRVSSLETQERRLTEILSQAATVEDILKVEKELERARSERESLAGKLNYLRHRIAYSSVNIEVFQPGDFLPAIQTLGFRNLDNRFARSFFNGWNVLQNFLAGIILLVASVLPWVPVLALVFLLIRRYLLVKQRSSKSNE